MENHIKNTKKENMSTAIATTDVHNDFIHGSLSIFNRDAFQNLYKISEALSKSSLIPDTLKGTMKNGVLTPYPPEQVTANCLLIVEQASRWGLSPFACIACASVVHGRLMWEGKLVSAVLDANLGVRLNYEYSGSGDNKKVVVYGTLPDENEPRTIEGTVGAWKTTGNNSPWSHPKNHERQLAYRGAREWARRHAPAIMLGVVTSDEFEDVPMRDATPRPRVEVREEPIDPQADIASQEPTVDVIEESIANQVDDVENVEELTRAYVVEVEVTRAPEDSNRKWTRYRVTLSYGDRTEVATTFSTRLGDLAVSQQEQWVMVRTEITDKGIKLANLELEEELV